MTHVALVIPTIDRIGGAESQVLLLAHGLSRRGMRVTVVAFSGTGGDAAAALTAAGIGFVPLGLRKALADLRGWFRFRRWLLRERPHIVHAHLPHAAWFARASRLFAPIPVLIDTIHTTATGTIVRRLGYRLSARIPDAVTAVSDSVARAYNAARMIVPERLRVIPNGIDLAQWQPDRSARATARRTLGVDREFLWLAAGRLEPVKDYPTLLRAFARLSNSAHLAIAGAGPCEQALRRLAHDLDIEPRVRFLGFQQQLAHTMQAADGFVLSSRWEGLPVAVLEASACALPTVATAVLGTTDVVRDGETGLLAAPGNPGALADAMQRLMDMPAHQREALGQRAQQDVTARYGLDQVLDRWQSLYSELLAQPR
ncbi:MAG TPA: glycosyltransferase [Terracidiphilus sp.]|jgi:glycosyltransferase involved in cell wall biosynthesis|nr:glycosyltransferase [Terracidiphilus sp.]